MHGVDTIVLQFKLLVKRKKKKKLHIIIDIDGEPERDESERKKTETLLERMLLKDFFTIILFDIW